MALPTIFPANYTSAAGALLNAPAVDRSGSARLVQGTVNVPATTAANTIIGLVPFQAGARFALHDKAIHCADLDTGATVTMNLGVAYADNGVAADVLNAFTATASNVPQSGGFIPITNVVGTTLVAPTDGWLVASLAAGPTTTAGLISFNVTVGYDG